MFQPASQKRKNRRNESLSARISWGAKQTSSSSIVTPSKKAVDRSASSTSSTSDDEGDVADSVETSQKETEQPKSARRADVFDFVGSGIDAETYEDQFKQAYHDETDMEDAFATDDTREPTMEGSDTDAAAASATDKQTAAASAYDDSDAGKPATAVPADVKTTNNVSNGSKNSPKSSPKPRRNTEPSILPSVAASTAPADDSESSSAAPAAATPTKKNDKKPEKTPSKKKLGKKSKPVKTMESVQEEGEEDDEVAANTTVVAETPSKKKKESGGFIGFFKRLGTPKPKSQQNASDEQHSGAETKSSSNANISSATSGEQAQVTTPPRTPRSPRTPRARNAAILAEAYEAMKTEIRNYIESEKLYIADLVMLRNEYLAPSTRLATPIEHVSVLHAPINHLIQAHSETLKIIEKRAKDNDIPIGTIFDDWLASVSDTYKFYRPKQVILVSLLDSSPTEKSMADHAAISNWLTTIMEQQQANQAANHSGSANNAAAAHASPSSNAAKRSQSMSASSHVLRGVPSLQELVVKPMHHLAGIASLLDRLLEVTPQIHTDHPNIRKASARAHLLQADLSTRGTTYRSMAKLAEIDAMLEFPSGAPPFVLADETSKRSYLLEGPMYQLEQQMDHSQFNKCHMFLFNDMALLCKQLARDPSASAVPSRSPSAIKSRKTSKKNLNSRQSSSLAVKENGIREKDANNPSNTSLATGSSSITPSGSANPASSSATPAKDAPIVITTPANKYIVVSRLMLDRMFIVDPEDVNGEMTTFANAKMTPVGSALGVNSGVSASNASANANGSTSASPSPAIKPKKGHTKKRSNAMEESSSSSSGDTASGASANETLPDMHDLDCLLEVVDMGVSIHRLRFASKQDKKLWLATLNSALANIKLSFSVNERQYLYKLLLTSDPKPVFSAYPDSSDKLFLWPTARFISSLASRQLIERLHSNTFATVNLQRTLSSTNAAVTSSPDSELALIKAEVTNLKREHARQIAELTARRELDAREIATLQKSVREKEAESNSSAAGGTRTRGSRSGTVDSSASSAGSKRKKSAKKAALIAAEARAEEYLAKYLELSNGMLAVSQRRDAEIARRLEVTEVALKEQKEQNAKMNAALLSALERNQRDAEEAKEERRKIFELLFNMQGSGAVLSSSTSSNLGTPGKHGSNAPVTPEKITTRSTSGVKPPVPLKPNSASNASPSGSPAPTATKGAPSTIQGGSWRAPPGGNNSGTLQSGSGTASPAPGSPGPTHPAIMSIGQRGKRPSSASLIAAAPLEMPESGPADSSESSTSGNPQAPRPVATTPSGPNGMIATSPSNPNLFGASGKSSSKLNLGLPANGGGAAGANGPAPPVSPGGRGRERKLKNVRFPDGEQEQGKSGSWLSKKLGFASPKTKKEETPAAKAPWRDPPSTATANADQPITVKKANQVDWSQTRAESYFSDDASDYDANAARDASPSELSRQKDLVGSEGSEDAH